MTIPPEKLEEISKCQGCKNYFIVRALWQEERARTADLVRLLRELNAAHIKTLRKYRALRKDRDDFRRELDRLAEAKP